MNYGDPTNSPSGRAQVPGSFPEPEPEPVPTDTTPAMNSSSDSAWRIFFTTPAGLVAVAGIITALATLVMALRA
jgi:hypothetical protein